MAATQSAVSPGAHVEPLGGLELPRPVGAGEAASGESSGRPLHASPPGRDGQSQRLSSERFLLTAPSAPR